MEEKEKELLLKDLSARLPYKVQCYCKWAKDVPNGTIGYVQELSTFLIDEIEVMGNSDYESQICEVKPYLRSMSSMTEEEKTEYHKQVDIDLGRTAEVLREQLETGTYNTENRYTPQYCHIDWLNAHHFDYRGLIEKGLALEAPEGMYKND